MDEERRTIWIVRRGSGKAQVHPSPERLCKGEVFAVKNWTECAATVDFGDAPIEALKGARIPSGEERLFRVTRNSGRFYEYDVTLSCSGARGGVQYAEGGSKPGVIIDG